MRGGIAERAKRLERKNRLLRFCAFHVLRFVEDDDRAGGLDELNGLPPGKPVVVLVNDILRLVERLYVDNHQLQVVAVGEAAQVAQAAAVVDEMAERRLVVEVPEVLLHHPNGSFHAFPDGDGGHHHDEFFEAVAVVQLEHGAQIDIRFARARLHFDGEIFAHLPGFACPKQPVAALHGARVFKNSFVVEEEAVAETQFGLPHRAQAAAHRAGKRKCQVSGTGLPGEQVRNGVDGLELKVLVVVEFEFHVEWIFVTWFKKRSLHT